MKLQPLCLPLSLCLLTPVWADLPNSSNDLRQLNPKQEHLVNIVEQALNSKQIEIIKPYLADNFKVGQFSGSTAANILNEAISHYPRVIDSFSIASVTDDKGSIRINTVFKSSDQYLHYNFLVTTDGRLKEINILKDNQFNPLQINSPPGFEIPFQIKQNLILIQGAVNGVKGLFLVDSGSNEMTLNSLYFLAQANPSSSTLSLDVNAVKVSTGELHVKTLSLGALEMKGFDVPLEDLSQLENALACKVLGIIGYDQLSMFELKFDFRSKNLGFINLDADGKPLVINSSKGDEIPFELSGHLPVLTFRNGSQLLRCALDCGVGVCSIDSSEQSSLSGHTSFLNSGSLVTVNGGAQASDFYKLDQLSVKTLEYDDIAVVFVNLNTLSETLGDHLDGVISFNLFKNSVLSINYKMKMIYILH